ncbi:MAG: hypothetical protein KKI02_09825 [Planctomycetes bacterium]|nr:hypothetical protein [Planctomycetota bacterium]
MNLTQNPAKEELAAILAGGDDRRHNIVWVGTDGEVHLRPLEQDETAAGFEERHAALMQLRIETLIAENGYVGEGAASDEKWVKELFRMLMFYWSKGSKDLVPGA